jgi:FkbM family methyltransferase
MAGRIGPVSSRFHVPELVALPVAAWCRKSCPGSIKRMNIYHFRLFRMIRTIFREFGILRIFKAVFRVKGGYEDAFSAGLKAAIRPGDVVWDIGANVGYYTIQFLEWTGDGGKVVAFEPLRAALKELNAIRSSRDPNHNIMVCEMALSDRIGEASFEGDSEVGKVTTTAHLSDKESDSGQSKTSRVKVMTADSAMSELALPLPIVTKIDVEGYEEEVLNGGAKVFSNPQSKHVFIEIHFERLDKRGKGEAPARIVRTLKLWGYKVRWLDASHLHAFRTR